MSACLNAVGLIYISKSECYRVLRAIE